ncbi:MAG: hypothetical protein KIS92_18690 [Planctomycetota bacterium]|nr:hypothetical protein [Planctomycetota bacterium]
MLNHARRIARLFLLPLVLCLPAGARLAAGEAYPVPEIPALDDASYKKWVDQVLPSPDLLKWKKIPWRADFAAAIEEAKALQRPILLWSDQGNPLGLPDMAPSVNTVNARQLVWSDEEVQKLSENFLCATAEVWTLATGKSGASDFFHKAGGPANGGAAHGLYLFTPDGEGMGFHFLSRPKDPVVKLLKEGLKKWEGIAAAKGYKPKPVPPLPSAETWPERAAKSGCFLYVVARDLSRGDGSPFPDPNNPWALQAKWRWNHSFLDLSASEAQAFLPKDGKSAVPDALFKRIAKKFFCDNANGNNHGYRTDDFLKKGSLTVESLGAQGSLVTVRMHGEVKCEEGTDGYNASMGDQLAITGDHRIDVHGLYGYEANLHGKAVYDTAKQKFVFFELVAVGNRKGLRPKNENEYWPTRMGVCITLEGQYEKPVPMAASAPAKKESGSAPAAAPAPEAKADLGPHREAVEKALQSPAARKDVHASIKIFGKNEDVVFKSADAQGVTIALRGNKLPLRWKDLSDEDRARLCLAALDEQTEALIHAAALAGGGPLYEKLRDRVLALDPQRAKDLAAPAK